MEHSLTEIMTICTLGILSLYMINFKYWKKDKTTFLFIVAITFFMLLGLVGTKELIYPPLLIFIVFMFCRSYFKEIKVVINKVFHD